MAVFAQNFGLPVSLPGARRGETGGEIESETSHLVKLSLLDIINIFICIYVVCPKLVAIFLCYFCIRNIIFRCARLKKS